ncbi:MAG: tRNA uridine-5-carboxymethylaminomethyl(34) synthesis GTPase MnmE [Bdellovibrionota bacterium]
MAGNYFSNDTIVAIATSLAGDGGVGIIRLSGSQALSIAQKACTGFEAPQPRYLHRIQVKNPVTQEVLDDGLAVFFPEGQSFTGEEVVELQLHGGRFLLQGILQSLLSMGGCRMALPGEFSFRAVKNDRMSLSGASALGQLISAKSLFEAQAARRNLGATRTRRFDEIASKIKNLLAQSELSIDFVDQDVEVISKEEMKDQVDQLLLKLDDLLVQMKTAQRLAKGLLVALVGLPNAGKSTLFNAILAEERAIVSAEAGTTRDIITEEFSLGPYFLRLADTAGLREASGSVEKEGITRAQELARQADLALLVIDGGVALKEVASAASLCKTWETPTVIVLNKAELLDFAEREKRIQVLRQAVGEKGAITVVSALEADGIPELFETIRANLDSRFGLGLNGFLPTEFQLQMVLECRAGLAQVLDLLRASGLSHPELISASLNSSVRALSDLVGETTPDTVLAKIFSEFCIGK